MGEAGNDRRSLKPKAGVLQRRDAIIAGLRRLLPADAVISEALRLKPYETDGLPAFRQVPLAVALPSTTEEVAAVLGYLHREGVRDHPAWRRDEPVRRCAADAGQPSSSA